MKLTNGDIWVVQEPLKKILEQKFPVMVSYKLAQLVSKLNEPFKIIQEVRVGLVKKYGKVNKKGETEVKEGSEDWEKFVTEFNELMNQEVEVDIQKVKLPEKVATTCDKCSHNMDKPLEIEPSILMALAPFVEV